MLLAPSPPIPWKLTTVFFQENHQCLASKSGVFSEKWHNKANMKCLILFLIIWCSLEANGHICFPIVLQQPSTSKSDPNMCTSDAVLILEGILRLNGAAPVVIY